MSGKPKRAAASPEEERARLRELTRELHEAAQDARAAAKELRGSRDDIVTGAAEAIEAMVNLHQDEISRIIAENYAAVQRTIEKQEEQTREHYAGLLGSDIADLVKRTCGMILHLSVPTISTSEWMAHLEKIAAQHERDKCSCLGCLTINRAASRRGQVLVGTKDEFDAYVAAGGDPGIILDAR